MNLAEGTERGSTVLHYLVGVACRSLMLQEIRQLIREHEVDPVLLESSLAWLRGQTIDPDGALWKRTMELERQFTIDYLSCFYTNDGNGKGWPVIHAIESDKPGTWILSAVNIFSPLFDDRARAEFEVGRYYDELDQVGSMPFAEYKARLSMLNSERLPATAHPWRNYLASFERAAVIIDYTRAELRATQIAIALELHRQSHNAYPDSLKELVPRFIEQIPRDPFANNAPLRYRRDGSRYALYSVAEDGVDDGGRIDDDEGVPISYGDRPDRRYDLPRRELNDDEEWVLIELPDWLALPDEETDE